MKFDLEFKPGAEKELKELIRKNPDSAAELIKYLNQIANEPYKYPKKKGKLKSCRALSFSIKGVSWRLVFRIFDDSSIVEILAIGVHDDAYSSAERRL